MLKQNNLFATSIAGLEAIQLQTFSDAIKDNFNQVSDKLIKTAGRMVAGLNRYVRLLNNEPETKKIDPADIDAVVEGIVIPDTPEGIDGP